MGVPGAKHARYSSEVLADREWRFVLVLKEDYKIFPRVSVSSLTVPSLCLMLRHLLGFPHEHVPCFASAVAGSAKVYPP